MLLPTAPLWLLIALDTVKAVLVSHTGAGRGFTPRSRGDYKGMSEGTAR